ncbi:TatD family hydrolase [Tuwongella immobilis]|uniref:Hydrolase TatD n=1 Tax=Tuwongella immobilis TaxID=692036 RepID=A0A6C2YNY1_9BACT|nr:TatD family hydrolase [Tuwongella immobilis]VIP03330.1 hydrolase : Putative deoxyribonuclease yabD OS=Planctomyces maris DSM 8797 GN=PM8797T_23711 PE=4 SV=1: TatD_DNase [Tuwongella immobilis]VTS04031.1 hydrolase : Putative deoxyribonuclease yabD OS=Planctomyces maris DSM 8797 GN=PM8797T_23711 PE=4 SV=1: TatD_DNase [Tuwongella immobilis]
MPWIDTHAHLFEDRFDADRDSILSRFPEDGIAACFCIGLDRQTSEQSLAMAQAWERIFAVVGIQPNYTAEVQPGDWEQILHLSQQPKVVAIGESGLDRYWKDRAPFDVQQVYFDRHLELAHERDLPIIIHNREADADILESLQRHAAKIGTIRGVMHSFSSPDWAFARACLDLGLHLSFAGMLTYPSAKPLREIAAKVPLDRLLIETDCPYLSPIPKRGQRNEPAYVAHTAHKLAELHQLPIETMADTLYRNTVQLFRLPE